MRKHNRITSRKQHYSKQTIRNLISASNCLSGVHSVETEHGPKMVSVDAELEYLGNGTWKA